MFFPAVIAKKKKAFGSDILWLKILDILENNLERLIPHTGIGNNINCSENALDLCRDLINVFNRELQADFSEESKIRHSLFFNLKIFIPA